MSFRLGFLALLLSQMLQTSTPLQIALTRESPKKNAMLRSRLEKFGCDIGEETHARRSRLLFDTHTHT